jgi:ribosome maturation factor RimP
LTQDPPVKFGEVFRLMVENRIKYLWELIEPIVDPEGLELVELEYRPQGKKALLRIYIDGPQGVTIEDCELIARQVGALLDMEDPIPGAYDLEVSSPGINRVLRKAKHFAMHVGAPVKVTAMEKIRGRANFKGILEDVSDSDVKVNVDGEVFHINLENIKKARLDLPEEDLFRSGAPTGVAATGE